MGGPRFVPSPPHQIISCGVLQGSILGPLLFLLYVNDLCNVSKELELILFAGDTNIFYSHSDSIYLREIVNSELEKITSWFHTNKLSINPLTPRSD